MSIQDSQTTLILGGARSGKSALAEQLCEDSALDLVYIATSPRFEGDEEMRRRISDHQVRRGDRWQTIEEEVDVPDVLASHDQSTKAILVDCMTLWLNNLIFHKLPLEAQIEALVAQLSRMRAKTLLVSNEVGQGIVPIDAETRAFRDEQGRLNQRLAEVCDRVIEVRAGLPLLLKPSNQPPITL